jgi:hypothetical protein
VAKTDGVRSTMLVYPTLVQAVTFRVGSPLLQAFVGTVLLPIVFDTLGVVQRYQMSLKLAMSF